MREIRSHTSLRGIAALLVVLYHYKSNLNFEQDLDALTGFFDSADHFVDFFFLLCLATTLAASILVYRFFEMPMRALLRSYPRKV